MVRQRPPCGFFFEVGGALFVGALTTRALLFGVHMREPEVFRNSYVSLRAVNLGRLRPSFDRVGHCHVRASEFESSSKAVRLRKLLQACRAEISGRRCHGMLLLHGGLGM